MTGRRGFVLAGAVLTAGAAGLAGCANPARLPAPPAPPPLPSVRVGERWRYAKVNLYNGQTLAEQTMRVAAVEPLVRVEVVDGDGATLPPELHAGPWNLVQENVWDRVQVFSRPCPLLPRRLEPGATEDWRGTYQVPGDSWHHAWSVRIDAIAWERVEVPAGAFEALRILRRIAFDHQDLHRTRSRRVETLWYAPAVNRWVRRDIDGDYARRVVPPMRIGEDRVSWALIEHTTG